MENIPIPATQDSNLKLALILLNGEVEELKKRIEEIMERLR